jgi:hypothetical protein
MIRMKRTHIEIDGLGPEVVQAPSLKINKACKVQFYDVGHMLNLQASLAGRGASNVTFLLKGSARNVSKGIRRIYAW